MSVWTPRESMWSIFATATGWVLPHLALTPNSIPCAHSAATQYIQWWRAMLALDHLPALPFTITGVRIEAIAFAAAAGATGDLCAFVSPDAGVTVSNPSNKKSFAVANSYATLSWSADEDGNPLWGLGTITPAQVLSTDFLIGLRTGTATSTIRSVDYVGFYLQYETAGYSFAPQARYVPLDGFEEVVDLRSARVIAGAAFQDGGMPNVISPAYTPIQDKRENINRVQIPNLHGYRPEVQLEFDVHQMADHQVLATLESRLLDPRWTVWLSLDAGATERAVQLLHADGPRPLGHKTIAGARFTITLGCTDVITDMPAIEAGAW